MGSSGEGATTPLGVDTCGNYVLAISVKVLADEMDLNCDQLRSILSGSEWHLYARSVAVLSWRDPSATNQLRRPLRGRVLQR